MRKSSYLKRTLLIMLITLLSLFFASNINIMEILAKEKTVLFISSYSYDWGTVPQQIEGIIEGLDGKYNIIYEFMDTKRVSYDVSKMSLSEKLIDMKSNGQRYDAVIVGDDDALRFVEEYKDELFCDIPIAFQGINDIEFASTMAEDEDIFGVVEAMPYDKNVKLIMSLFPHANRIVAIVDSTTTGKGEEAQFVSETESLTNYEVEVIKATDYTRAGIAEKLSEYDENTIIFYLIMSFDKNGELYLPEDVENILKDACKGPVIRMTEYGISDSVFGGITVSHRESGKLAAKMVDAILSGNIEKEELELLDSPCEYVFNYKMLEKFNISEVMLPEGSTIINKDENKAEREINISKLIVGILFVIVVAIILIVIKEIKSKRTRKNTLAKDNIASISDAFLETDEELISKIAFRIMKQEFSKIMLIDTSTKETILYFVGDNYTERKYMPNYEDEVKVQLDRVIDEDKEHYKDFASIENVVKNITKVEDKYITEIRQIEDGVISWYEYRFTYFDEEKNIILMLKRKLDGFMVHEVEEKDRLSIALAKAKKRSNEKSEYLSELSHEIRNLVGGIKGLLEVIKDEPSKFMQYIDKAMVVTDNLSEVINDFLDYSKMESGNMELHNEIVNIEELKEYIGIVIEPLANKKKQEIVYNFSNNYYTCFICDGKKMKQILINVLTNAVKYTPKKGKIIFNIDERVLDKDNLVELKFEIIDNGIGMTQEFLKHVYEPFKQEQRYKVGSTGLGLAITKNLVDLMNGKIKIESQKGVGTCVTILMICEGVNISKELSSQNNPISNKEQGYNNINFNNKITVLLAEDNDINMEVMETMLSKIGINVIKANDGVELIDKFRENEDTINLLITDALMPKMDGISAVKIIRDTDKGKDVLVVMMTANSYIKSELGYKEANINYALIKPFEKREIIDILIKEFYNNVV